MAREEKPYRVYRGGRVKGKVPVPGSRSLRVQRRGADRAGDQFEYRGRLSSYQGAIPKLNPVVLADVAQAQARLDRMAKQVPLDEPRTAYASRVRAIRLVEPADAPALKEQRLDCLDRCLDDLKPEQRDLIVEYYQDAQRQKIERRRNLAQRLGITMNALGIRACRIREALMTCVEGCRARREAFAQRLPYRSRP